MPRNFDVCTFTFEYLGAQSCLFASQLRMGSVTIIFDHAVLFAF